MRSNSFDRRTVFSSALILLLVPAAGCKTVGPDYVKPEVTVPTEFRSQVTAAEAVSFADQPWWSVFQDPALQSLVNDALVNNYDIKIAAARIEQARAAIGIVRSQSKPQVGYRAGGGLDSTFVPTASGSADTATYGSLAAGFEAAWEFDIWGRIKRQTEAAEANLYAQEEVRSGVLLTLLSDVASGYFRLLALDRELVIAQDSAQTHKKTFDLFNDRFQAGRDSKLPSQRAMATYNASLAQIQDLRRLIVQQENAISILTGGYPRAIERGRPLTQQITPAMPVGSTTDLLQRRPDIREAEQKMRQANAEVGVAVANKFPRIGLGALLGGLGVAISGDADAFVVGNIGLNVTGPIFTGGRLDEIVNARKAFWDETIAAYRKTVVGAFQETSDALIAQQTLVERRRALESQVAALRESSDLALLRFDAGRASYFEVLEAQQQLFPAEDALAQTQRDQLLAMVSLYRALGGGWKSASSQQPAPIASAQ